MPIRLGSARVCASAQSMTVLASRWVGSSAKSTPPVDGRNPRCAYATTT